MPVDLPKTVSDNLPSFTGREWVLPELLQWWDHETSRLFVLTGEPGTGKSMLSAWLAGCGPLPGGAVSPELARFRSLVRGIHFCIAKSGNSPKSFAQSLANQLTRSVPGFGAALAATLKEQVKISVEQQIGQLNGGSATGVFIERLELGGLNDELSFDRLLRDPLKQLYQDGYKESLLLLADALDESLTYTGGVTVAQLLARLDDLPAQIRWLVTTRPDPRVLYLFPEITPFDLIHNAPPNHDDVKLFAHGRLRDLREPQRTKLTERISEAADGIFLHAHLVLQELLKNPASLANVDKVPLPRGLSGLYQEFLNREFAGPNRQRWFDVFKPVLGPIVVARGRGLTHAQLDKLAGRDVTDALETAKQYLDGALPDGPFRPFHKSFADFLLEDKSNVAYHIEPARAHLQIADRYLAAIVGATAWLKWDDYGMRHLATHLAEAIRLPPLKDDAAEQETRVQQLVGLVVDRDFREAHRARVNDAGLAQRDFEQTVRSAALCVSDRSPLLLAEAVLAMQSNRKELLRPSRLFELARDGDLESAEKRLVLQNAERFWHEAALITLAWLAIPANPVGARQLRDRLAPNVSDDLRPLLQRLDCAFGLAQPPGPFTGSSPDPSMINSIIDRLAGGGGETALEPLNLSGLAAQPDSAPKYLAEMDGPLLLAFAAHHPPDQCQCVQEYVSMHAANHYAYYRNRSLAALLKCFVQHQSQEWVRDMMEDLVAGALAGSPIAFRESLGFALIGLRGKAGQHSASSRLDAMAAHVEQQCANLSPMRGEGDSWSYHLRRLVALAETFFMARGDFKRAQALLNLALQIPYGFAGFRSKAMLTVADALRICEPANTANLQRAMQMALISAHNVQDHRFCLADTARVNAMQHHWSPTGGGNWDLKSMVQTLASEPDTPAHSAVHVVGEQFRHRSGNQKLPIPPTFWSANTLAAIAEIHGCAVGELVRLNREKGWTATQLLPAGAPVNIPDPEMLPLIAARLSAEVVADGKLSRDQRVRLLQALVPVAAQNLTALDAVLARLLLVSSPADAGTLDRLQQLIDAHVPFEPVPGIRFPLLAAEM